ncbi:adenine nucleotide alpha hydrolases-like protein [Guyanagaster necrorhizus]|uniref:tRNA(Ile)-lysidine synthetase n=1 Tax=Guyanagaster necrorhizus TaxID=856835 RepID=A0A9P8AUH4_9AGAR|nr:adenine nucleotide alpha hydrolases-like protein [Guyanagaster necrorhizus MCA 3950]KAG7448250.1 adenine nucleotide alpha hydrolases-like protein [Guyanagaster necrorhizus MCA 3950]
MQRNAYTFAQKTLPVSREEFAHSFMRCVPPSGWCRTIGNSVANSGGPDSTALVFLLKRYVDDLAKQNGEKSGAAYPMRIVSISVDHGLQECSTSMAGLCAQRAVAMGVGHYGMSIPWNLEKYPDLPKIGVEGVARLARYELLHRGMERSGSDIIAFGHHMDDQVETSLMRLAKGSKAYGAAGMKPFRRWGMGVSEKLGHIGWTGLAGMHKWIVRPLLDIPKDRLLATCESNQLEYVIDPTNFQPSLTLRNAVRGFLASGETDVKVYAKGANLPGEHVAELEKVGEELSKTAMINTSSIGPEQLRASVKSLGIMVRNMDLEVEGVLSEMKQPSPIGTFAITEHNYQRIPPRLQLYVVLRILRYVSPHPWGSLRSTSMRRMRTLELILAKLKSDPYVTRNFVAGSGVKWTSVIFSPHGIKELPKMSKREPGQLVGWTASRQPPTQKELDFIEPNPLYYDVTASLQKAFNSGDPSWTLLYDCRFAVRFDITTMPSSIIEPLRFPDTQIVVVPTPLFHPRVVFKRADADEEVLHSLVTLDERTKLPGHEHPVPPPTAIVSSWISIQWIRPFTG